VCRDDSICDVDDEVDKAVVVVVSVGRRSQSLWRWGNPSVLWELARPQSHHTRSMHNICQLWLAQFYFYYLWLPYYRSFEYT